MRVPSVVHGAAVIADVAIDSSPYVIGEEYLVRWELCEKTQLDETIVPAVVVHQVSERERYVGWKELVKEVGVVGSQFDAASAP